MDFYFYLWFSNWLGNSQTPRNGDSDDIQMEIIEYMHLIIISMKNFLVVQRTEI